MAGMTRERAASLRVMLEPNDGKARSGGDEGLEAFRRESDLIKGIAKTVSPDLQRISSLGGVFQFLSNLCKWLYKHPLPEAFNPLRIDDFRDGIVRAIVTVCRLLEAENSDEVTLKMWNQTFDRFDPLVWIQALKVFVSKIRIMPEEARSQLIQVSETAHPAFLQYVKQQDQMSRRSTLGALLGSSSTPPNPSELVSEIRNAFVPVLEELSSSRHTALASLCLLLHRDRRNRRSVAGAFGPWVLASGAGFEQPSAECFEILVTLPDAPLFATYEMPFADQPQSGGGETFATVDRGDDDTAKRAQMRRGSSLKGMLKRFSSSGKEVPRLTGDEWGDTTKDEKKTFANEEQIIGDAGLVSDLANRPARSRQSLERVYGRAPAPPPPKSPSTISESSSENRSWFKHAQNTESKTGYRGPTSTACQDPDNEAPTSSIPISPMNAQARLPTVNSARKPPPIPQRPGSQKSLT